jgi:hypothetical protein
MSLSFFTGRAESLAAKLEKLPAPSGCAFEGGSVLPVSNVCAPRSRCSLRLGWSSQSYEACSH